MHFQNLQQSTLLDFLCKAKKHCYAGSGSEVPPSRTNSHDLAYQEGNLSYYDSYLGGERFGGEEALWQDGQAIWCMNYVGRVIGANFSGDFLKECLSLATPALPFRGPAQHQNGLYSYHCSVTGDFDWYHGYEEIFYDSNKIYECLFHGGRIV